MVFSPRLAAALALAYASAAPFASAQDADARASVQYPVGLAHRTDVNFTELFAAYGDGLGPQTAWTRAAWNGLTTFARAPPQRCFGVDAGQPFDVAVIGAPFDTATSFRPGARFGPNGIRKGSRRLGIDRFNVPAKVRITDHIDVVDCGDVPMVLTDNKVALRQLELANAALVQGTALRAPEGKSLAKDGKFHPRVLTLGGDHTITLPLLRGVAAVYGPHLDTWKPRPSKGGPWLPDEEIPVSHGSYFWYAFNEGLLAPNNSNILGDYEDDYAFGWVISHAWDAEDIGWQGIVKKIKDTVGDNPVYISLDIDVLDPAMAPATGTPEIGGFTTREIKKILHALEGLKIVGADIVEVAPDYDSQDEITSIAAANIGWDILGLMAKTPLVE
ncbi:agmatinase [Epithele typhae]|uniref:agmatinase n=1 Tax=Epithele typhae TaxID=378194 RepID=UPI002007BC3E|nr:agmatinase [Epithele typhae]KAH9915809.1 agmatinase [Epithele typhae]